MQIPIAMPEGANTDRELEALRKQIAEYEKVENKAYLKQRLAELKKKYGKIKEPDSPKDPVAMALEKQGIKVTDVRKVRTT